MVYKTKAVQPKVTDFDAIVIGSGSGGGVTAHQLQQAGKRVAIVEADTMGGECPNYGCIPTKALLQAAETFQTVQEAADFGIITDKPKVDWEKLHAWKNQAVYNTGTHAGKEAFERDGIKVINGHAHFIDPWTISVNGTRYSAKKFLLATGTHDFVPPIPGLKEAGYIGYREALEITKPPKSLLVLGGGAIGCEFSEVFSTFGVEVTLVEFAPRLIAREDSEMGELMQAVFEEKDVNVMTDSKAVKVEKKGQKKIVHVETHGKITKISVDEILLAAGKRPNTDLGLENAGVKYDDHGIKVNAQMQTNVGHIWAAGDVTGGYMFTHTASYESRIAANNMLHNLKHHADYSAVPRCVFVSPEAAAVGATEAELKAKNKPYQVGIVPISILGRANTSQKDTGFVKIIANKKGVVLGGSIIAPRAGEMIHEITLAVQYKMKASRLEHMIHAFPTWNQAIRSAARKIDCR